MISGPWYIYLARYLSQKRMLQSNNFTHVLLLQKRLPPGTENGMRKNELPLIILYSSSVRPALEIYQTYHFLITEEGNFEENSVITLYWIWRNPNHIKM